MCFVNSSDGRGGNSTSNSHDDHDQQQAANILEVLLHEHGWIPAPGGGVVGVFEFEVANANDSDDEDDDEEDDGDFTAYEWMARTDLEQFDKETEQQYWHEVMAEAEASQRNWDQACASCPDSDLPVLLPDYLEATALNANLIRLAQEESASSSYSPGYSSSSSSSTTSALALTTADPCRRRQ